MTSWQWLVSTCFALYKGLVKEGPLASNTKVEPTLTLKALLSESNALSILKFVRRIFCQICLPQDHKYEYKESINSQHCGKFTYPAVPDFCRFL